MAQGTGVSDAELRNRGRAPVGGKYGGSGIESESDVVFFFVFCFVLFCFVLFCFVLFCFVLFCFLSFFLFISAFFLVSRR